MCCARVYISACKARRSHACNLLLAISILYGFDELLVLLYKYNGPQQKTVCVADATDDISGYHHPAAERIVCCIYSSAILESTMWYGSVTCMFKVVLLILLPHTEPESYTKAIECLTGGILSANQWVIEQDSN